MFSSHLSLTRLSYLQSCIDFAFITFRLCACEAFIVTSANVWQCSDTSDHCLMIPDINDCGVTRHLVTHHIVWNTRHECLRHRQNLLCSIHTASRVTSCVVWFTRLFKVSLMLYQCHARFISLSQLLPVLDAHFVYIRSLSLPLESWVASTIQFLTPKFDKKWYTYNRQRTA